MPVDYDLQAVSLPRLSGIGLKLFVQALENPLTSGLLVKNLLHTAGVDAFRRQAFSDAPTPLPFWPAGAAGAGLTPDLAALDSSGPRGEGFAFASAEDYRQAYQSGRATPLEAAEWVLEAVAASNAHTPPLRGVVQCNAEDLRAQARASAERWRAGHPLSALDGVPVAIKEEFDLAGYATTVGTAFLGREPAAQDAAAVARLRAAGALLIGKANMHEIGIGVTGHNPHHGVARNPYHLERYTGGSSSGPAAVVAAGICPIALGADGGGSIRIPAGLCGVVGLKPTFGRVSERGAYPLCWSVAHNGPLAASARDAALAYALMAGPDRHDPNSLNQPPVSLERFNDGDLWGLRIGVYAPWFEHAAPDIVARCREVLAAYEARGARLVEVQLPGLEMARVGHLITIASEMCASLADAYRADKTRFGLDVRTNLALAHNFQSADYVQAQRARTRVMAVFAQALETADVIATPTTAITAPPVLPDALPEGDSDLSTLTELMRFAVAANFTGLPAISIPVGYDQADLPVGLQLMGRAWSESLLLRLANAAEQVVVRQRPALLYQPPFVV